ncbi:hypothetical protein TNCV_5086401 [Trichonephila clavipes]|uniref:Uncharacterized protein n=1 Tax=Trichonephila clavipes TaxID=2585209 RepID=A0A8X6SA31_TRICX|nr:hypothetical protein TNCV_5086401 [Trichonephila clavipes]
MGVTASPLDSEKWNGLHPELNSRFSHILDDSVSGDDSRIMRRKRSRALKGRATRDERKRGERDDESRSFFRVHAGYFSNIPKCIKAEFIASWGCSQSSVVSSSKR